MDSNTTTSESTEGLLQRRPSLQTITADGLSTRWLTRRQAAEYCQVSEATISKAVVAGTLAHVRVGNRRSLRFRKLWIDEWLNRGFRAAA